MSTLKIKHREFEIIELISDNICKCSFKNKQYIISKIDINDSFYKDKLYYLNKLKNSGVKQPKLFLVDKNQGYVVREYLDGVNLFDYILDHDFDENIYKQVYFNSYQARLSGINLDFNLKAWTIVGDNLYYSSLSCEKYDPNKDFTKKMVRQWFLSEELADYFKNNGVLMDKSRIKDEKEVNKEMVLMTCKYYL